MTDERPHSSLDDSADAKSATLLLHELNAALGHDFCPWANRWVYWLKNPFWVLVLAVALSITCGIFLNPGAYLITGVLLLIVGAGVALPWVAVRGVNATATFDVRRGRVGQTTLVRLRITNRWPWPVWGLSLVRGFALRDASDTDEGVSLARVPAWSTMEFAWPFEPRIRGKYPLITPSIETAFPFGVYRAARGVTVNGQLIVWPQPIALHGLPDAAAQRADSDTISDRRAGDCGDILGTRGFREGDALRRVHWIQTARRQSLIVTERQAAATAVVRVVLDLDPASHPAYDANSRHPGDSLELLILAAAGICESLHRQHCCVELQLGDRLHVASESAASFHNLMDHLSQAAVAEVSRPLKTGVRSSDFVIVVTTQFGERLRGTQLSGAHVLAIAESAHTTRREPTNAWLSCCGLDEVLHKLPTHWKGACNAR